MQGIRVFIVVFTTLMPVAMLADSPPANPVHGQVFVSGSNAWRAWDETVEKWVSPDEFWQNYADSKGGLTWGRSTDYPPYKEVKQHDTLMIELESGTCLMEFFHSRWRRANDVRRWHDRFTE